MTKFKLTSHNSTDRLPASIQVADAKGDLVCIIFVDRRLAPQAEDFTEEEMEYFIFISKYFQSIYESLAQKDEVIKDQEAIIRQQETELSFLINTPI